MKSFIIIFFGVALIGCRSHYVTYKLINGTPYDLEIEGFSSQQNVHSDIISIAPNSIQEFSRLGGETTDPRTFFSIDGVDSVKIIFDAKKVLIQTCHDFNNYTNCPSIFTSTEATITDDDYNNAVPIE